MNARKALCTFIILTGAQIAFAKETDWNRKLYQSVQGSNFDLAKIRLCLEEGADPNWIKSHEHADRSILGSLALSSSLNFSSAFKEYEKAFKAAKLLFEHGAELQRCDACILYFPIASGQYMLVELFLEKGASAQFWPKHCLREKVSPIEVAQRNGHDHVAKLLEKHGARPLDQEYVIQARFLESARSGSVKEMKALLNKGADINGRGKHKESALLNVLSSPSAYYGEKYRVVFLLENGANVNLSGIPNGLFKYKENVETYPLHIAIYVSHLFQERDKESRKVATSSDKEILRMLLKQGAFVASEDEEGCTPLHIAAQTNNVFAATLLLEKGTKVMAKDKDGNTPLDYAKSSDMILLLKKHGAKEQ